MPENEKAGIKSISCSLPSYFLPAEEFAEGRGIDRKKLEHLGIKGQAVPNENESVESLMAKSIERLFDEFEENPKEVGYLMVTSEEIKGKGDNLGNRIISLLKRREIDLTGVNSTTSLAACNPLPSLIEQGVALAEKRGEDVLVVAGDRSIYQENSAGEETQGMAACAFLIGKEPKVGVLDKPSGCKSDFVFDWWRPQENGNLPVFDGIASMLSYLFFTSKSQREFKKKNGIESLIDYAGNGIIAWHRPSEYMVELGSALLYAEEKGGLEEEINSYLSKAKEEFSKLFNPEFAELFSNDGGEALARYRKLQEEGAFKNLHAIFKEMNSKVLKKVREKKEFKEVYENLVKPGVKWPNYIGNSYTASIGTCLLSALNEKDLEGERAILTSYGSGANSTTLSLKILDGYRDHITKIDEEVGKMKRISFKEYVDLRPK